MKSHGMQCLISWLMEKYIGYQVTLTKWKVCNDQGIFRIGLRLTDIEFPYAKLKVRPSSHQTYKGYINNHIKPHVGSIPLSKLTVSIGADAIEVLKEQRKKVGREIEYVFPSPNGGPISPDSVLNMLHRVLERAGLPKFRFHDLRHTFATLALQNGVDIKTVSGMLGHFSAGFTLDTYAHVTTSAQKEAANTMGGVLRVAANS